FLATRLPCSGGWRGVGYEVTTLKVHVASRALSGLPIDLYKPLESLGYEAVTSGKIVIKNLTTRRDTSTSLRDRNLGNHPQFPEILSLR
ncbi:MAG: hypothetical protein E6Z02_06745, partial [Bifidobacterium breve]|nr:hypothetical protein [Bifidobacterium breve]